MSIAIEKAIPMPSRRGRIGTVYPFAQMEVGDSFFTDTKLNTVQAAARRFANSKRYAVSSGDTKTTYAHRFTYEERIENGVDGVRCWRREDGPVMPSRKKG